MAKPILAAMLSCQGTELTDAEKKLFAQYNPLGITLFNRNIRDKQQIKNLISELKNCLNREDVLIAVDQEGGRVRRLIEPEFRHYISQSQIGELAATHGQQTAVRIAAAHALLISEELRELGINWNYAPVIDLAYPSASPVLSGRCFDSSPLLVTKLAEASIDAYHQSGIASCIKHLPSLGPAEVDPHLQLPVINKSLKELADDFYPAQHLASAVAGMTAHILLPEVDSQNPVTQSSAAISQIIRGLLGFKGFLITDAIDMHSLSGSAGTKTKLSLEAGCDCVCYCFGKYPELLDVCQNASPLSDKSLERLEPLLDIIHTPHKTVNIPQIYEDYLTFSANLQNYDEDYDATEVLHRMEHNLKGEN